MLKILLSIFPYNIIISSLFNKCLVFLSDEVWSYGDLSVTSISTSILGHAPISSLKLNVSLCLYSISMTSIFSTLFKYEFSKSLYFSNISLCHVFLFITRVQPWIIFLWNPLFSFFLQCVYKFIKVLKKLFCSFKSIVLTQILLEVFLV